ncbi:hypothetical protein AbraIFM66951_009880 [Aspergillus brasiliensis]|uniref:Aminoglycoside phosphotransferase domain-containing protein n=1 Tax=Aspergillus brasiliensis TaxID=319629 RepID=A0A9W5YX20_9EURO|nr:hypothetical protein AbraCBS73388_010172 [Aspergillus brasiliensis]GKZ46736.1 hypothetical protein AbraIFM66951_009880 [Aspergillus brasiliensis]
MDLQVTTASREELIQFCIQRGKEGAVFADIIGATVIKVTPTIVAKWGYSVTATEAAMQEFAYDHINHDIVRIPRVYRFVEDEVGRGFLFMDYVPGRTLSELDLSVHTNIIPRITNIIANLGQIQHGQKPGPLGEKGPQGYLWGDDGVDKVFVSIAHLNRYLNRRLALRNDSVDLSAYLLVLCHMDLVRRNMILGEDNKSIYLLDWAHAGFYPRFYELAALSCMSPYDEPYEKPLIAAVEFMMQLTDDEKRDVKLVRYARAATLRWQFPEEPEEA